MWRSPQGEVLHVSLDHWMCLEETVCDATDWHTSVQSPKPGPVGVDRSSVWGVLQNCWTGWEEAVLFSFWTWLVRARHCIMGDFWVIFRVSLRIQAEVTSRNSAFASCHEIYSPVMWWIPDVVFSAADAFINALCLSLFQSDFSYWSDFLNGLKTVALAVFTAELEFAGVCLLVKMLCCNEFEYNEFLCHFFATHISSE